jgi:hypothetical protein
MTLTVPSIPHGALQPTIDPINLPNMGTTPTTATDLPDMNTIPATCRRPYHPDECLCPSHSEKFVTRKEYDEIKDSLSRLETILTSTNPSGQEPSGSANDEVAAAVNMVKKQAGILSKVISPSATAPPSAVRGRGQDTSYGNAPTSGSLPTATSSFSRGPNHSSQPQHPDSVGDGSSGNASFAYNPFSLNVPSQSGGGSGGPSDVGDEDYYHSSVRNTISPHSHSTSTEFSRPTSSAYNNQGHLQPMSTGHFQSNMPASPFHGPTYSSQHRRIPAINLGDLVVEDQSHSSGALLRGNADPSGPLSTLANLANASSMTLSSHRSPGTHLQPTHNQHQNQGSGVNTSQSSPPLTLAPIGAQSIPRTGRKDLSISTSPTAGGALTMLPPPSIAPPRLPLVGGSGNREAQLRRVLQTCLPRREVCDRLIEYYVRCFAVPNHGKMN